MSPCSLVMAEQQKFPQGTCYQRSFLLLLVNMGPEQSYTTSQIAVVSVV